MGAPCLGGGHATGLLRLLLLCCVMLGAGATPPFVNSLADLQTAVGVGGVWLV